MTSKRITSWSIVILFAVVAGILIETGIRSGIHFQIDQDELVHAQDVYLLYHGAVPYRQFFMTYTPIFHYLISPVFLAAGYTLAAMTWVRWLMVVLFLIRLALSGWLALNVFGKRAAGLFILFFLMDPFTMYTTAQIRPDNFMMLLFTGGLVLLFTALKTQKNRYFFWSGIVLSVSGLVLLKIAPSLFIVFLSILGYGFFRHRIHQVQIFLLGCTLPVLLLISFAASSGYLQPMLQSVLRDSYALNQSQAFPLPLTHYLEPGKPALYDLYGTSWNWWPYVEITEIALSAIGLLFWIVTLLKGRKIFSPGVTVLSVILVGSLIIQVIGLTAVRSMFIQYFLPITWLVNMFAAVVVSRALNNRLGVVMVTVLLLVLSYFSAGTNIARSYSVTNPTYEWVKNTLPMIPEHATVFPNLPFRPIAYPLAFGGYFIDMPQSILSRFPPLVPTLETNHVQYLLKTYDSKAYPDDFFTYVTDRFREVAPDVYIRIE